MNEYRSALIKIAAECHRAKWRFSFGEDHKITAAEARKLVTQAFDDLHRIGDMAIKLKDPVSPADRETP